MKKVLFVFAIAATFAACNSGDSAATGTDTTKKDTAAAPAPVQDTTKKDTAAAPAKDTTAAPVKDTAAKK